MKTNHTSTNLFKFLAAYLVMEAALYGGIPIALGIELRRLALSLAFLFLPAPVFVLLLYHSTRYRDRPKLRSIWFAVAVCAALLIFLPALDFWALSVGLLTRSSFTGYLPYALAMAPIATAAVYYQVRRRFSKT